MYRSSVAIAKRLIDMAGRRYEEEGLGNEKEGRAHYVNKRGADGRTAVLITAYNTCVFRVFIEWGWRVCVCAVWCGVEERRLCASWSRAQLVILVLLLCGLWFVVC
jgi:hypothetical protein